MVRAEGTMRHVRWNIANGGMQNGVPRGSGRQLNDF